MIDAGTLRESLVSRRTGIVRDLWEARPEQDDPSVFVYCCMMSSTERLGTGPCVPYTGGAGLDREQAIMAALGEAVERYCSAFIPPTNVRDTVFSTYEDLEDPAVSPDAFTLFSEQQYAANGFPFVSFTPRTPISWTSAYSLTRQTQLLVPASLVYLPYMHGELESLIAPTVSTGLSTGRSREEAALHGLYEIIERDAVTLAWLTRSHRGNLDPNDLPDPGARRVFEEHFTAPGLRYTIADVRSNLDLPTVVVLQEGNSSLGPIVTIGSAARHDREEAVVKALVEAAQGRGYVRHLLNTMPDWIATETFTDVTSFERHAIFFSRHPEHAGVLDFLRPQAPLCTTRSACVPELTIHEALSDLVGRVTNAGGEVLVKDLTTEDVARIGLRVVRVLVPQLLPLHGNHNWRHLGSNRLTQALQQQVTDSSVSNRKPLNPYPHPFP